MLAGRKPQPELNDEILNDDRQPQHHPRRHSVRPRADRLAIFLQYSADGEAARRKARRRASWQIQRPSPARPRAAPPRKPAHAHAIGQRARGKSARRHGGRQPRRRHCRLAPHQDRNSERERQHLAEGRAHRRSVAGQVPRHRRPQVSRDRAVLALGHGKSLLCGIRLGRRLRLDRADARSEYAMAAGRLRQPDAGLPR